MSSPRQCKSKDFFKDLRCQGLPGHKGPHWGYDAGGHLIQWVNKKARDPKWKNIACSWIPPGSKGWISPINMDKYHYLTIWAETERKKRNDKRRNAKNGKTRNR